jgi:hypothetical protein
MDTKTIKKVKKIMKERRRKKKAKKVKKKPRPSMTQTVRQSVVVNIGAGAGRKFKAKQNTNRTQSKQPTLKGILAAALTNQQSFQGHHPEIGFLRQTIAEMNARQMAPVNNAPLPPPPIAATPPPASMDAREGFDSRVPHSVGSDSDDGGSASPVGSASSFRSMSSFGSMSSASTVPVMGASAEPVPTMEDVHEKTDVRAKAQAIEDKITKGGTATHHVPLALPTLPLRKAGNDEGDPSRQSSSEPNPPTVDASPAKPREKGDKAKPLFKESGKQVNGSGPKSSPNAMDRQLLENFVRAHVATDSQGGLSITYKGNEDALKKLMGADPEKRGVTAMKALLGRTRKAMVESGRLTSTPRKAKLKESDESKKKLRKGEK